MSEEDQEAYRAKTIVVPSYLNASSSKNKQNASGGVKKNSSMFKSM